MTFVSYARSDSEFALRLGRDLKSAGVSVWLDQLDIPLGERWDKAVQNALVRCDRMVVILSPAAVESDNVMDEVAYVLKKRKPVIPVLHLSCDVPYQLDRLQRADFLLNYEVGLASLLGTLGAGRFDTRQTLQAGEVRTNPGDGQSYVWIPPGEFQMGCSPADIECDSDESPAHKVRLTRGFWLGQTQVTQAAYQEVMRANPSTFKGPQHPVECVTWDDAGKYCEAAGGRLPTEAEWEYAARAGSPAARYGDLEKIAWYHSNSSGTSHPVGQKQPNSWGLYDMLGNVWEWVADSYHKDYTPMLAIDPKSSSSGNYRVWRGGSWYVEARLLRASFRGRGEPGSRIHELGFRCVRDIIA